MLVLAANSATNATQTAMTTSVPPFSDVLTAFSFLSVGMATAGVILLILLLIKRKS
ncbi:MAG: hypothetical protein ACP5HQ_05405 [Thermoprotei archaeon]